MKKYILLFSLACMLLASCTQAKKWSVQFADSEMARFPQAWQLDHGKRYVWGYAQGVGCLAMLKMWKFTGDSKYYDYVYAWADTMVRPNGAILSYKAANYNIDYINSGKILFDVYDQAQQPKYRMAMDTLLSQFNGHPQTSDSVFWHKQIYPHQIWLDGIYMAGPYMAQYGQRYNRPDLVEKALHEVVVTYKHTLDPKTGLLYHAYDESREQQWANKATGQSPHFWGRAIGWYLMAAVDILDFTPDSHPMRKDVVDIINKVVEAMVKHQDESGLWYQIVDLGTREGNYLEASVSSMLMYSCAKAVNKGYLPEKYRQVAEKAFDGITTKLIKKNEDGTLSLTQCCSVGGLGGKPYRDGSFEYYMSEKIRDNDAKATGPFIMGCIELNK